MSKKVSLLTWNESYNCHSCRLASGIELNVSWDSTGSKNASGPSWKASALDRDLGRFKTFEEAEIAVIKFSEVELETALNKIVDALMKLAEAVSEEPRG